MSRPPKRHKPTKAELRAKRKLAARDQQRTIEGRRVPVSDAASAVLDQQIEAFRAKFGRDLKDDDPIFFDPDADTPQPMSDLQIEALQEMTDVMTIGPFKFKVIAEKLELIDRVIADKDANDDDWSSAYRLLVEMTNAVIEQTEPANRLHVPEQPPMVDPTVQDIRKALFLMRADFAEYWAQYLTQQEGSA